MSKNTYTQNFFSQKAKKEGYSARSVYKLEEIHKKHLSLRSVKKILDLGAAPGSWTQYLQKQVSQDAHIFTVDIHALSAQFLPLPQVTHIQADFTDEQVYVQILALGPFDLIVSDAAPPTTGNKSVDTALSEQIVESVFHIATQALTRQGIMVAKIFQGAGMSELLKVLRTHFSKVSCLKPKAVRPSSFETYLICR